MTEEEKDAFLKLGMISTKFAELEYYSELILSRIISGDDKLFALTIIKDFSLHKKLELIKNLNKVVSIQYEDINSFVETVKQIKFKRNQLIHGVWNKPVKGDTGYTISVSESKIKHEKGIDIDIWSFNQTSKYGKADLERLITELDLVINLGKKIDERMIDLLD